MKEGVRQREIDFEVGEASGGYQTRALAGVFLSVGICNVIVRGKSKLPGEALIDRWPPLRRVHFRAHVFRVARQLLYAEARTWPYQNN